MLDGPVGDQIAEDLLERRTLLPRKVTPVTLRGNHVVLRPLDPQSDAGPLFAMSSGAPISLGDRAVDAYDSDALIWRYLAFGPFDSAAAMIPYLSTLTDAPDSLALCVLDAATEQPIGVVTIMSNAPEHLKIELGNIWYSPVVQRTHANLEATWLMLRHCFELGYRRVEWKCNALNERSRRAALRMGFQFEGVQEAHMIVKNRNRDTAWYRILDHEWPAVDLLLSARLAVEPRSARG